MPQREWTNPRAPLGRSQDNRCYSFVTQGDLLSGSALQLLRWATRQPHLAQCAQPRAGAVGAGVRLIGGLDFTEGRGKGQVLAQIIRCSAGTRASPSHHPRTRLGVPQ